MPDCRILLTALVTAAVLSGCTGQSDASAPDSAGAIPVVASTNVYGEIAQEIGGDRVRVTSLVSDPAQDPHQYEADARARLAVSKAQVVIENGGGYDDFVETLRVDRSAAAVLNVAELSGYDQDPPGGAFNEHLWYDLPTMIKLSDRLTSELQARDPGSARLYSSRSVDFTRRLAELQTRVADLRVSHAGDGVAITEPVPLYLLQAAGLDNLTPGDFSEAIEEDSDVPPTVLAQTVALFDRRQVRVLVYNAQTGGPQTDALLQAAGRNHIPAVPVTETLPAGQTYLSWMTGNVDALEQALAR